MSDLMLSRRGFLGLMGGIGAAAAVASPFKAMAKMLAESVEEDAGVGSIHLLGKIPDWIQSEFNDRKSELLRVAFIDKGEPSQDFDVWRRRCGRDLETFIVESADLRYSGIECGTENGDLAAVGISDGGLKKTLNGV